MPISYDKLRAEFDSLCEEAFAQALNKLLVSVSAGDVGSTQFLEDVRGFEEAVEAAYELRGKL